MSASDNERRSPGAPASWLKSNLAAIGAAAVLTVYSAGYMHTEAAAEQFSDAPLVRRAGAAHPISLKPIAAHPSERPAALRTDVPAEPTSTPVTPAPAAATDASTSNAAADAAHQPIVDAQTMKAAQRVASAMGVAPAAAKAPASTPATPAAAAASHASQASTAAPATTAAPTPTPATTVAASVPATAQPAPAHTAAAAPTALASTPAPAPAAAPAPAPVPAHQALAADDPSRGAFKDGTYLGWGTSRHGDIQAKVVVQDGWIVSATIAQCLTQYSCSWIDPLPPEVTARQSADIDYVTGATQSSNAFFGAVQQAIAKAAK